jgi:hypothetical protein
MKKEIGEEKTCEGEPLHIAAHLARCQPEKVQGQTWSVFPQIWSTCYHIFKR